MWAIARAADTAGVSSVSSSSLPPATAGASELTLGLCHWVSAAASARQVGEPRQVGEEGGASSR